MSDALYGAYNLVFLFSSFSGSESHIATLKIRDLAVIEGV